MQKVIKVLPLVVIVIVLTGCALPSAQPYALLYPTATASQTESSYQPDNLTQTPTPAAERVCVVIAAQALNMRAGAGMNYSVIAWLANGDKLTMTGTQRGAWIEVIFEDRTGWINSNYCKGK